LFKKLLCLKNEGSRFVTARNNSMRKYRPVKQLGEGSFACVHQCVNDVTGETVAIKHMKQKFESWNHCKRLREVQFLTQLKHENIIKCTEVILEPNHELFLVFEFAPMNLWQLVKNKSQPLGLDLIKMFMAQLFSGLACMHKQGIFHRDIKPENLLICGDVLKIADFGCSREIRSRPPYTCYVSTRWYRAPELLLSSTSYSSPIDMWACGCILGELFLSENLFPGDSDIDMLHIISKKLGTFTKEGWPEGAKLLIHRNISLPIYQSYPLKSWFQSTEMATNREAQSLLNDLLCFDPNGRPTAQAALQHAFFDKETESLTKVSSVMQLDVDSILRQITLDSPTNNVLLDTLIHVSSLEGKANVLEDSVDLDDFLDEISRELLLNE